MSNQNTLQIPWQKLTQATVNILAGYTADINTPVLVYDATYTTAVSALGSGSAQNPVNRALVNAVRVPNEANGIEFIFAVADTDNDGCSGKLWAWDSNGPGFDLLVFSEIRAGAALVTADPTNGATLTGFRYADAIGLTADNSKAAGGALIIQNTADGIATIRCDLFGVEWIFMDYDFNAYSGTAGTDCITFFKWL